MEEFIRYFEQLGMYSSEPRQLWSLRVEGAFEGWQVRATKDMRHQYFIEVYEFAEFEIWPFRVQGDTPAIAASRALVELERRKQVFRELAKRQSAHPSKLHDKEDNQ
jgi:hypothetical protein